MSRRLRLSLILLVVVLVLAAVAGRLFMQRKSQAAAGAAGAASAPLAIDLAPGDLALATRAELGATLPISGGLRAVNNAMLRAKVAAEVKEVLVREGDRVQIGQLVAKLDGTEYQWRLRQAEDQAAAAKSQLEIAERSLANNKALVDQGFISKTALETTVSSAAGAQASLQAARAAAELARKSVADTLVRAPLAGLVSQRLVQPGERVGIDAKLIEIVDLSRIELEAAVAPEEVSAVRIGQSAKLQIDGLADVIAARVARINPSTQAGTRAVTIYLTVDAHHALRQGLFARGSIELQRKTALVVPLSAVRYDQAQPYVLVADASKAIQRTVTLGARGDVAFGGAPEPAVEITAGLSEGQNVLRGSVGSLRAGAALKLPAAASAPR